jgi:hypothetical protein
LADELASKNRYMSVPIGVSVSELESTLGVPIALVQIDARGELLVCFSTNGGGGESLTSAVRDAVRYMPKQAEYRKVMIYNDTTVYAYFYVDQSGIVRKKEVIVS